jgi:hypothetical protein
VVSIRSQFPAFSLEDKALLQEGSIDTNPIVIGPNESLDQEENCKKRWGRVFERK